MLNRSYDVVIVGSGPNGLAAGVTLSRAGLSVAIIEGKDTPGGGLHTAELTHPGFLHDVCSAIHPFGVSSPFFKSVDFLQNQLSWVYSPAVLAHPLDDGSVIILEKSIEQTAGNLGEDSRNYLKIMGPLLKDWDQLLPGILAPLRIPSHPVKLAAFGLYTLQSALGFIHRQFRGESARALFAGLAAHSMLPLDKKVSAGVGLILGLSAHHRGWPFPAGGARSIARALVTRFGKQGGDLITGKWVNDPSDLPPCRVVMFDVTPRQLLKIYRDKFPERYRSQLEKYRYGPGVFKIDWALDSPIPFRNPGCLQAATVHIGGSWQEIARAEAMVWEGKLPEQPFIILSQLSLFDTTRAPQGKHTAWAYCHVPAGSPEDMTGKIESQIERFAPGFRQRIIGRHTMNAREMQAYNPNYVGGDINGGVLDWRQLFTRPTVRWNPCTTPDEKIYLCSSSTPPGGGVHGMGGYHAAGTVLKKVFKFKRHELLRIMDHMK